MKLEIKSIEELHRYDSITENLGFDNMKLIYICATIEQRLKMYGDIQTCKYTEEVKSIKTEKYM